MPPATVQKITGAITILISLMKPSPSGFSAAPTSGHSAPDQHAQRDADQHLDVEDFQDAEDAHGVRLPSPVPATLEPRARCEKSLHRSRARP